MKKIFILSGLAVAAALWLALDLFAAPGNAFGPLDPSYRSVLITTTRTNRNPLEIRDAYGSNIFGLLANLGAGSNYWGLHIGTYTPGKQVAVNVADFTLRMSGNSIFAIAFGSDTNTFGCDTGSAIMSWGDVNNSAGGVINPLFSRQAVFYPQHLESAMINQNVSPTILIGAAAGSGGSPAVTLVNNNTYDSDVSQKVQLVTGSGSLVAGTLWTITFRLNYANPPKVIFSARNAATAAEIAKFYVSSTTASTYVFSATAALTASTTYLFDVIVIQ